MEPPSSSNISIRDETGRGIGHSTIERAIARTLELHQRSDATVDVLLTSDQGIQALNRQFRQMDEPTDVLSFPAGDMPMGPLGDIAISIDYAERQAQARGVGLEHELGYLAIHGALHLLGMDDEEVQDRAEMMAEMNRAAVAAGLPPDEQWHSLLHEEHA
jgi:probable rRNA maturation factor